MIPPMNPKLELLFARRSVRRFTGEPVSDGPVRDLLDAAMAAPSAAGKDPWHFIVVRERPALERIAAGLPNGRFLPEAGLGVVVCGDLERAHGRELSYLLQDAGAAIENLLLAAQALGLGACWLGVHPRADRVKHLSAIFHLPPHILPISVVAVGHPAERPAPRTRYRDDAVHIGAW
jgi:nitroreductase